MDTPKMVFGQGKSAPFVMKLFLFKTRNNKKFIYFLDARGRVWTVISLLTFAQY